LARSMQKDEMAILMY